MISHDCLIDCDFVVSEANSDVWPHSHVAIMMASLTVSLL